MSLIEEGAKVQIRGVDETRQPFHLFKTIKVGGLKNGVRTFPSESSGQLKQPYKLALPAAEQRPAKLTVEL